MSPVVGGRAACCRAGPCVAPGTTRRPRGSTPGGRDAGRLRRPTGATPGAPSAVRRSGTVRGSAGTGAEGPAARAGRDGRLAPRGPLPHAVLLTLDAACGILEPPDRTGGGYPVGGAPPRRFPAQRRPCPTPGTGPLPSTSASARAAESPARHACGTLRATGHCQRRAARRHRGDQPDHREDPAFGPRQEGRRRSCAVAAA